jgi:hypothetical protein
MSRIKHLEYCLRQSELRICNDGNERSIVCEIQAVANYAGGVRVSTAEQAGMAILCLSGQSSFTVIIHDAVARDDSKKIRHVLT